MFTLLRIRFYPFLMKKTLPRPHWSVYKWIHYMVQQKTLFERHCLRLERLIFERLERLFGDLFLGRVLSNITQYIQLIQCQKRHSCHRELVNIHCGFSIFNIWTFAFQWGLFFHCWLTYSNVSVFGIRTENRAYLILTVFTSIHIHLCSQIA